MALLVFRTVDAGGVRRCHDLSWHSCPTWAPPLRSLLTMNGGGKIVHRSMTPFRLTSAIASSSPPGPAHISASTVSAYMSRKLSFLLFFYPPPFTSCPPRYHQSEGEGFRQHEWFEEEALLAAPPFFSLPIYVKLNNTHTNKWELLHEITQSSPHPPKI